MRLIEMDGNKGKFLVNPAYIVKVEQGDASNNCYIWIDKTFGLYGATKTRVYRSYEEMVALLGVAK